MTVIATPEIVRTIATPKRLRKIPDYLVWEVLDGKPFYRRGYKDVLRKLKTVEEIMGTSSYQSLICNYIQKLLNRHLNEDLYDVMSNEIGVHFEKNDNASNDIAIYDLLPANRISKKYTDYPAKIVIEVDIDIDLSEIKDIEYLNLKTQKLLDFGTEKVIWILTNVKKIMVAKPKTVWLWVDWHQDIEILEGIHFNIQAYLDKRGINPDEV